MAETRRMADEAKRLGEEVQEGTQRFGREYQKAAEDGFEAASRSFGEANKGFQALAAEMMEYSKASFDDAIRTWTQLTVLHLFTFDHKRTRLVIASII